MLQTKAQLSRGVFEEKFPGEFVFDPMWGLSVVNVQSTKGSHGHLHFTIKSLPLANDRVNFKVKAVKVVQEIFHNLLLTRF